MAMEYIHKMTKKDEFLGLNNMQLFLGMMMYPNEFKKIKMIAISTPKLKEIIGVDTKDKYIAFDDVFSNGEYKIINYLEEANRKKPSMRDKFDKDVLSVDERINVAYLIYTAQSLRIIPDFKEDGTTWYAPTEAMTDFSPKDREQLHKLFQAYFASFHQGLVEDNWENASLALVALHKIQEKFGGELLPPTSKITLEIFLNHYNIFDNLTFLYILAGLLLFVLVLVQILRNKNINILLTKIIYWVIVILALLHTFGLGVRWYVGGHAPWSNAYESMIYIAWAAGIAGVVFFLGVFSTCYGKFSSWDFSFCRSFGSYGSTNWEFNSCFKILLVKYSCLYYHRKLWIFRALFYAGCYYFSAFCVPLKEVSAN